MQDAEALQAASLAEVAKKKGDIQGDFFFFFVDILHTWQSVTCQRIIILIKDVALSEQFQPPDKTRCVLI